jgi:hypothetical protein
MMNDEVTVDDVYVRVRQGEWSSEDFIEWINDRDDRFFTRGLEAMQQCMV